MHHITERTSPVSLSALRARAVNAGVPESTADDAQRITATRFRIGGADAAVTDRAQAYFWGIVRRRALRGRAPVLRTSMLALSLANELTEAGFDADEVRRQVARSYGETLVRLVEPAIAASHAA